MQISKKVIITISVIGVLLLSNYMIFQYVLKQYYQHLNAKQGKIAVYSLLFLDQNKTQPVKYLLASGIYYNIVGASLKQNDGIDDIEYYSFLCDHWGDDLKNVILKSKKADHMNSTNPRNYELFLEGAENLDQLCISTQEAD